MTKRFYTVDDIAHAFGFTRCAVYAQVRNGVFPPPVKVGRRASRWIAREADAVFLAREQCIDEHALVELVSTLVASRTSQAAAA